MELSQSSIPGILLENKAEIVIDGSNLVRARLLEEGKVLLMILKAIDHIPKIRIGDRDLVRCNPHNMAILLM